MIKELPEPIGKGIRITERSEIDGIALVRYYPKRLKRLHQFDDFSRDLWRFKKHYDVALIEKLAKAVATELDLDLLDCLRWASGKSESQKKRKGILKRG